MFKALVMFFVSCGNSLIKIWMTALSSWFWAVTWVSSAEAWLSSRLAGRYLLLLMALYHLALVCRCRIKFNLISLPVRLASISLDLKLFVRTTLLWSLDRLVMRRNGICKFACLPNSRDRIVVSTLRCGRSNPGSNPGHGSECLLTRQWWIIFMR